MFKAQTEHFGNNFTFNIETFDDALVIKVNDEGFFDTLKKLAMFQSATFTNYGSIWFKL